MFKLFIIQRIHGTRAGVAVRTSPNPSIIITVRQRIVRLILLEQLYAGVTVMSTVCILMHFVDCRR